MLTPNFVRRLPQFSYNIKPFFLVYPWRSYSLVYSQDQFMEKLDRLADSYMSTGEFIECTLYAIKSQKTGAVIYFLHFLRYASNN